MDGPPSEQPASQPRTPGFAGLLSDWRATGRDRLAAQPAAAVLAVGAAAATLALVLAGAAPADQVGAGIGRFVPAAVAVLAPIIAALAVVAPWQGLIAWLVAMPLLLLLRVQVTLGEVQLTLTTAFVAALVVGLLLQRSYRRDASGVASRRLERTVSVGAGILCLLVLASAAVSPDPAAGLPIVLHGVIEPVVLLAVVVHLGVPAARLVWLLVAMASSVAIAGVYSVTRISKIATTAAEVEAQRAQIAHLTYYNVGIYGDMLVMALPLVIVALLAWRRFGLRPWLVALLLIALGLELIGLYATFSKSAWIGALVVALVVGIALANRSRARAAVLVAAMIGAAFVVPYPLYVLNALGLDTINNPYASMINWFQAGRLTSWNPDSSEGEVSIHERFLATEAAVRMVIDHPLLGVGPGQFGTAYGSPAYHETSATRKLGSAHNFFPNLAAELGLPAALLVLSGFLAAAASVARAYRSGEQLRRLLAIATGAAGIGFLVVGATFGVDLYRDYRVMNADVVFAALLVAVALLLGRSPAPAPADAVVGSDPGH